MLTVFSDADPELDNLKESLVFDAGWTDDDFKRVIGTMEDYKYSIDIDRVNLPQVCQRLVEKRETMVRLLENPMLLEHEYFTEVLQAVFHLTEELSSRPGFDNLPDTDRKHLQGDIKRVYQLLLSEWLLYIRHLKQDYPYLFSLAVRTNPFDSKACVEVG